MASPVTLDRGLIALDSGVVDEHVETTEGIEYRRRDLLDRPVIGQIDGYHQRIVRELGGDRLEPVGAARHGATRAPDASN